MTTSLTIGATHHELQVVTDDTLVTVTGGNHCFPNLPLSVIEADWQIEGDEQTVVRESLANRGYASFVRHGVSYDVRLT